MPAAPFWTERVYKTADSAQQAYDAILGFSPWLLLASFSAYLAGEFLNSYVLAKLKLAISGRFLWVRTISSTIAGQFADSFLFISVAFTGNLPAASTYRLIVS